MKPESIYGFKCGVKDEKKLITGINAYLKTLDRITTKTSSPSLLKAKFPFRLKHFYFNLNKGVGTYFEVFPNEDLEGNRFYPSYADFGWLIKMRIDESHPQYEKEKTEGFLHNVLNAPGLECKLLEEK